MLGQSVNPSATEGNLERVQMKSGEDRGNASVLARNANGRSAARKPDPSPLPWIPENTRLRATALGGRRHKTR